MIKRCTKPSNKSFPYYGGRGIAVCERWRTFENFLADMGEPPAGTTLDRIDGDGHYEPSNCRWVSKVEQARNVRSNRMITHGGVTKCIASWAEALGIPRGILTWRLFSGWSDERALTTSWRARPRRTH